MSLANPARKRTRSSSTSFTPDSGRLSASPLEKTLDVTIDGVFAITLIVAPSFMGGRHPVGAFVFIAVCCILALLVSTKQALYPVLRRLNLFDVVLLGGAGLVLLQILPVPSSWLGWLNPGVQSSLPLWGDGTDGMQLGSWRTISLVPELTRQSLGLFLAYLLLYFSATFHYYNFSRVGRAIKTIAVACVLMALLGVAQGLLGNGKFLWIYDPPFRTAGRFAQGPFINPNHFAHFLALGVGPLVWWICQERQTSRSKSSKSLAAKKSQNDFLKRAALMSLTGLVLAAGVLSNSRGGVLVLGLALLTAFALILVNGKRMAQGLGAMVLSVVVAGLLVWSQGHEAIMSEMQTVNFESIDDLKESAGREVPWKAATRGVPNHFVMGSGAGTFSEVYKLYSDRFMTHECTHAESGYLQVALETGVPGLLLLGVGLFAVGKWVFTGLRGPQSQFMVAILPGLLVSLVHSVGDFVWYIPACVTLLAILIACSFRVAQGETSCTPRVRRPARRVSWQQSQSGLIGLGLTVVLSLLILRPAWIYARGNAAWETYLTENHRGYLEDNSFGSKSEQALARLERVSDDLRECIRLNPNHYRARLRLAETLLHKFEISQRVAGQGIGIVDISDVATTSGYQNHKELQEWLEQATDGRHKMLYEAHAQARIGTRHSPLSGEGYVCLAQLSFLYPELQWQPKKLLAQALAVRPFDGEVLFGVAAITNQIGTAEETADLIQRALRRDPGIRKQIVAQVGPQLPFTQFVELVQPDRPALVLLIRQYNSVERTAESAAAAEHYYEAVDDQLAASMLKSDRAVLLKEAAQISIGVGNEDRCLEYEREALKADPNDFRLRLQHARRLVKLGEKEEGAKHLRWCVARKPDQSLKLELREALIR